MDGPTPEAQKKKGKAPYRKPLAGLGASGLAGNLAVIFAFNYPDLPPTVIAAYVGLILPIVGFAAAYLIPPEN